MIMKMNFKMDKPPVWKIKLLINLYPFSKGDIITAYMKKPLDGLWIDFKNEGDKVLKTVNIKLDEFIRIERVK